VLRSGRSWLLSVREVAANQRAEGELKKKNYEYDQHDAHDIPPKMASAATTTAASKPAMTRSRSIGAVKLMA
jgi:hypothetical protein